MSNHRYSKWWWQDWRGDACLQRCSFAAKGLWMDVLCLLNDGNPYGHLHAAGKDLTAKDLVDLIPKSTLRQITKLLNELETKRVFSRTDAGTIYSRRMVRDGNLSEKGTHAAEKRWNKPNGSPNGSGNSSPNEKPNNNGNGKPNAIDQKQNHRSSSSSDARAREEAPPEAKKVINLIFPEDRQDDPPEPRRLATTGHMLESTVKQEPYGKTRTVDQQLAILRGEKSA